MSQNRVHRRPTSWFFLWFSYDFGVTRNLSSNADAMVLASARLRGIHHPDNIQNGGHPGGCLSNAHWLGPWRQHLMMNHGVAAVTRVDLLCALFCANVMLVTKFSLPARGRGIIWLYYFLGNSITILCLGHKWLYYFLGNSITILCLGHKWLYYFLGNSITILWLACAQATRITLRP